MSCTKYITNPFRKTITEINPIAIIQFDATQNAKHELYKRFSLRGSCDAICAKLLEAFIVATNHLPENDRTNYSLVDEIILRITVSPALGTDIRRDVRRRDVESRPKSERGTHKSCNAKGKDKARK